MPKQDNFLHRDNVKFENIYVDYIDGDIAIFDNVHNLSQLYPLKPMTNLVGLCTSGELQLTVNSKDVLIREGIVMLCPPNIKIENCQYSEDFECKILCLSDHIVQGLLRDKIGIWNRALYINQTNVIQMSDTCKEEFGFYYALLRSKIKRSERRASREVIQTIIRAMLIELCDVLASQEASGETPRILQSKHLFNRFLNMLANSEVKRRPAAYYAAQLNISPKYLTMLCQQYSDKSASQWIIQYTLDDIRHDLVSMNLSIKEISVKLGFANISHFGSYVRKHLGVSPSKYRDKNIREKL